MSVPVLTAVSDAQWEAEVVAGLERGQLGVVVVRRCVDLPDLLATAATGQARAVLLSADVRRLDREALSRLAGCGVAVVGVVPPQDEPAADWLRLLGVDRLLSTDATLEEVSAAVVDAVAAQEGWASSVGIAEPREALVSVPRQFEGLDQPSAGAGRVVAIWGPTGAPGRTTVAVGVAAEAAERGLPTLLVDADVYGGVVAQLLGLLDEAPGVAAATRAANAGRLDAAALAGVARAVTPLLRVLTGITRADRWPELRPAAFEVVLEQARSLAELTVVDCGFCLERDEELSYDAAVPRRNGATVAALESADVVVAVGSADPVGIQRLVRGLGELKEVLPELQPRVVVNRLRGSAIPGDSAAEIRGALSRYAGVPDVTFLPYDVASLDRAAAAGRTLAEAAPGSALRQGLMALAAELAGVRAPRQRRRLLARRP